MGNVIQHPMADRPQRFTSLEGQLDLLVAQLIKEYGDHYTRLLLSQHLYRMAIERA